MKDAEVQYVTYFYLPARKRVVSLCADCGYLIKRIGKKYLSAYFTLNTYRLLPRDENEYLVDVMRNVGACHSSSIARRLIFQGYVFLNDENVCSISTKVSEDVFTMKVGNSEYNIVLK